MTPEQRTAARQRLQKRIGMPYTRSFRYTAAGNAKVAEAMRRMLVDGFDWTPAITAGDMELVTLPSFKDFAERHR